GREELAELRADLLDGELRVRVGELAAVVQEDARHGDPSRSLISRRTRAGRPKRLRAPTRPRLVRAGTWWRRARTPAVSRADGLTRVPAWPSAAPPSSCAAGPASALRPRRAGRAPRPGRRPGPPPRRTAAADRSRRRPGLEGRGSPERRSAGG